jgi:hypothetical protein
MRASWQSIQKIPCDVRAYLRFSIFFLQFRHLKQLAQKAWSPVKMARSSILFPQLLQLYVQLLQIREPSPRRSRFASESSRVPQVLHRKQSICHLLPARVIVSQYLIACALEYSPSSNALPSSSTYTQLTPRGLHVGYHSHLSAALAGVGDIVLIQRAVRICQRRLDSSSHDGRL